MTGPPAAMAVEDDYLRALASVSSWRIEAISLSWKVPIKPFRGSRAN